MLKKIPTPFWFFVFSLAFFAYSVVRLPGAEADEADIARYSRDKVGLQQAIIRYHRDVNALFNDHTEKLFAGGKYTVAPPEDKTCSDNKNISTYCLGVRAVEQYDAFLQAMDTHRPFLRDKNDDSSKTLEELRVDEKNRAVLINEQIVIAEKTLNTALAAYDQLQTFYPIHVKYQGLIESLETYRDGLANIRREVEKYPGKFQNVTTNKCT